MKISTTILNLFTVQPTWTTATIMAQLGALGFTKQQVSGGIGYLRAKGMLNIGSKLSYGHIFH